MKADRRRRQAGYTLVELIVATAIGALVMGAVASIFLTTAISTNVATSRVDASNQVRGFQLTVYDDVAFSSPPAPAGCGSQGNPCTTQPLVLQGSRMANQPSGSPSQYSVSYSWDSSKNVVVRQVTGGGSRIVATGVTSYSWYVDQTGAHPSVVVSLTVTVNTYNASYSESQSFQFYPRVES